ncbi:hypothetical protein, unlikely [Trypanosoma brucei gambiense DAL972]|uniref:Uncharacterized protein n=1 Tax=Trypanosoma brucei gambiense (strain MHOM/CI/86/DAL972) TaxID=679716 RepID=C9ZP49_TRYB9|nr:hypothetical protein, unlikely [Trypanosoma brucei gambiense DAL972]CBH11177.1 hypothetical protein, unlikely [Trypanosoma brucei gambiense DAL972]|eukprot:XP_011773464.1 hypothetical protein, unlikely [Trypanosoma brucei gambiense DAL972]
MYRNVWLSDRDTIFCRTKIWDISSLHYHEQIIDVYPTRWARATPSSIPCYNLFAALGLVMLSDCACVWGFTPSCHAFRGWCDSICVCFMCFVSLTTLCGEVCYSYDECALCCVRV